MITYSDRESRSRVHVHVFWGGDSLKRRLRSPLFLGLTLETRCGDDGAGEMRMMMMRGGGRGEGNTESCFMRGGERACMRVSVKRRTRAGEALDQCACNHFPSRATMSPLAVSPENALPPGIRSAREQPTRKT